MRARFCENDLLLWSLVKIAFVEGFYEPVPCAKNRVLSSLNFRLQEINSFTRVHYLYNMTYFTKEILLALSGKKESLI